MEYFISVLYSTVDAKIMYVMRKMFRTILALYDL
jgi:hypothetical protein